MKEKDIFEQLWAKCNSGVGCDADMRDMLIMYRALKLQIVQFSNKIEKLEKQDLLNTKTIEKYYNKKQEYKQKIEAMETESLRLLQQIEKIEFENSNLQSKIYNFKDTTKMYEDLINEQKTTIEKVQKEYSELCIKIDFLETELKDYKDTLKENIRLKRKNINLKTSRATKYNQLLYFIKEYERLKKVNKDLTERNKLAQPLLNIELEAIEKLTKENKVIKQDLKTTYAQLNDVQEDLESVCDECDLQKENESLKTRVQTLEESKISVSKAPSRWIDEIVDDLEKDK